MEEENEVELLQRYRRDRRILLDFILSGSLIKKVVMPPGAVSLDDVDLDQVSVDYILGCAKKGGMLELSEAIRDYHDNTLFPHMNNMGPTDEFFLVSNPGSSGSPPKRSPPPIPVFTPSPILPSLSKSQSFSSTLLEESLNSMHMEESLNSTQVQELSIDDIDDFEDDDGFEEAETRRTSRRVPKDASALALGLPSFATGIGDDDLRETAFEILLASAGAAGGLIIPMKEKKKDKRSRLMRKLGRSKDENVVNQSQHASGLVGLLETMRVQMEISEAMDIRTRQGLLNALVGKTGKRMDTLLIPLELLCCISRTEFPDKKAYIRWQKRQLNMLEEGLINYPAVGFGESGRKAGELRILLAKIEESESFPSSTGELQRTECLRSLRETAIPLAERPARGDLTGEICHWSDGYHLNVRLYERLLSSVFDVLDEGKLTEEVEEILELLKSTWRILGITETIHYICYAWVLFRQFVITSEQGMLQHVIEQLKKVPLKEQRGPQERLLLKSLLSRVEKEEGVREFTFLQSFLSPIKKWADKQLGDYHMHFSEGSSLMEYMVAVSMLSRRLLLEESELAMQSTTDTDTDQIEIYISQSIKNAFTRTLQEVGTTADATNEHPLALLAEQANKLLKKDATMFMPILSQRHPQATVVSASLLHKLYGNKLKPFVSGAEHLTEDVVSVFPAADSLEQHVMTLITSTCEEATAEAYFRKLNLYKIETISGTLVLRWVNSQLGTILSWVERAIQQENYNLTIMLSQSEYEIVHIPERPPIPPHEQPTADVYAAVIDPKHANTLVRKLNKTAPLENLRHVKRVRNQHLDGGKTQLSVILCISCENGSQPGNIPKDVSELMKSYQLSAFITKVSKLAASSKEEWEEQCNLWPTSYHPPNYNIDGITGFSEEDANSVLYFMKLAIEMAKSSDGQIVNAAVIVDPLTKKVIARACDQVRSQDAPKKMTSEETCCFEQQEAFTSCCIANRVEDNILFSDEDRELYTAVSCLYPWKWGEQQLHTSFWHPLRHAAIVAIEYSAARDRNLFPGTGHTGGNYIQMDHMQSSSAGSAEKRQKTNLNNVEDDGKLDCHTNGFHSELARPYLCTGCDIFLVWEPCTMCAMALVHQRIRRIFYAFSNPNAGALGSVHRLQGEKSLNHRYAVFRVLLPEKILEGDEP